MDRDEIASAIKQDMITTLQISQLAHASANHLLSQRSTMTPPTPSLKATRSAIIFAKTKERIMRRVAPFGPARSG